MVNTFSRQFIVNVYLNTAHRNRRQNSLFATEKLLRARKNQQWQKPAEICERKEGKSSGPHRKSTEKFICFMPIPIRRNSRSFLRLLYTALNLAVGILRANISMSKDVLESTIIRRQSII